MRPVRVNAADPRHFVTAQEISDLLGIRHLTEDSTKSYKRAGG
jgi:hypothetical protein